ncbi:MAG: zf-HC2 domain-containing protein [Myxococcota bacterium]
MSAHQGPPISWLRLEQYALGELPGGAQAEVAAHLATCGACRAVLERITTDQRALPPLSLPALAPGRARGHWRSGAAAAAVLLLTVGILSQRQRPPEGVKGAATVLTVVRSRDGSAEEAPQRYLATDRFKLLLTCTPPQDRFVTVSLREGSATARTILLTTPEPLTCGNRVALPGAFRLDSTVQVELCAHLSEAKPGGALGPPEACAVLLPEGPATP